MSSLTEEPEAVHTGANNTSSSKNASSSPSAQAAAGRRPGTAGR
eukprot:CAMPEP_0204268406 /NCGR_PEP_ID=MMETSP0468-20130131/12749_1 /ASSEMBLY_ACC=CAM_ASM_000383 /TAXON_ID=2969 /ORGANISM="Oxyrrhis marina" /LENGTH=43 /DNA_ID= /DNA_START= /DNA_END= /DNA_ORIENTATION=